MGETPALLNCHHLGGSDHLPPQAKYIGRPSKYGNPHSSKNGILTKEECVALHRIDLYNDLRLLPLYRSQLQTDLGGHDLACWCAQPNRVVACHGINYLHILSDQWQNRDYSKSVVFYLVEDLRYALKKLEDFICHDIGNDRYLSLYTALGDVRLEVQWLILTYRKIDGDRLLFILAIVLIDLELAEFDPDLDQKDYRLRHAHWNMYRFFNGETGRSNEPIPPNIPLPKKGSSRGNKKNH